MLTRPATLSDIPAIISLGVEALELDPYPNLVISEEKMRVLAVECISSAANFAWVAEIDSKVVASVGAFVQEMMVFERKSATVVQFYTREPGAGLPLIREFLRWVRARRAIKMTCFTLEREADPRIGLMLKRLGLSMALPVYMETY
jgi:hypothetical protein